VCGKCGPTFAYFGSVSPAFPTPRFLQLVGAQASKTARYQWRDGSTISSLAASSRFQTALLAIERDALTLPNGWQMRWSLKVDGKMLALLEKF
jgi:hypothetical protein